MHIIVTNLIFAEITPKVYAKHFNYISTKTQPEDYM